MLQKSYCTLGKARLLMSWLKDFTIAIVEEDSMKIGELVGNMPQFTNLDDILSAHALIEEAISVVDKQRTETFESMQKIKKSRVFIQERNKSELEYIG